MNHERGWVTRTVLVLATTVVVLGMAWSGAVAEETTSASVEAVGVGNDEVDDGDAKVVVRFPADGGSMDERTAIAPADVASVGEPEQVEYSDGWRLPVRLSEEGSENFTAAFRGTRFLENPAACPSEAIRTGSRNERGWCLLTVVDGDVVATYGMSQQLAAEIRNGAFQGEMVLAASNESEVTAMAAAFGDASGASTTSATPSDGGGTVTATTTTSTASDSGTTTTTGTTTTESATTASSGAPGFGLLVAAIALLALTTGAAVTER